MNKKYDAIIIGAGVGGLVCGCYLAKAGLKVLIVEKNDKPGGYCSSFQRNGYTFDAGVHEITHCGKSGLFGKIIRDLKLNDKVNIKKLPVSDLALTPDFEIGLCADYNETREQLYNYFPKEKKQIESFFKLFDESVLLSLNGNFKNRSFKEFIEEYFSDEKLKRFWYLVCYEIGIPISKLPAIVGFSFCRAFIKDGGYYPEGGMQSLASALLKTYEDFGGNIIFSQKIKKIYLRDKTAKGVELVSNDKIFAKYIVSNCDPIQTYFELVGKDNLDIKFVGSLTDKRISPSAFIVFLGLKISLRKHLKECLAALYCPQYLSDNQFDTIDNFDPSIKATIIVPCSFAEPKFAPEGGESVFLFRSVPYLNREYWEENKVWFSEKILKDVESLVPNLQENIVFKEIATPFTLYKYTGNYRGASRGWASDFCNTGLKANVFDAPIKGLFFAGHWVQTPVGSGGISMAGYSGYRTAKEIVNLYKEELVN